MTSPRVAVNFTESRDTASTINLNTADFENFQSQWNAYINGPLREAMLDGTGDELMNAQSWFHNLCAQIEEFMFGNGRAVNQGTDILEAAVVQSQGRIGAVTGSA